LTSFLAQALVFIGSAIILVPIFRRLGFGSVLGYLMAGILVGPQGMRLIPNAEHVMHFAELGVIFLLFMIGLEIRPSKLWNMRRHLLGLGGTQIALSTFVFTGFGFVAGLTPIAAGVLGFSLSLSSTAFAMQTLFEKSLANTEFGRSSFAILLMQDLVAIPALALIPALGLGTDLTPELSLGRASVAVLAILGMIAAGHYLIRPLLRIIASSKLREVFTGATLFIVLGVAAVMQSVGLSAALGTFIAGVLLSDSEYRHEIEANLEPFKSLLMGLFFIGVGMSVSVDLIAARPLFVLSTAILYTLIKASIIYLSGRMFSLNHDNAKLMATTIAQGGEFAFVIFGIAASGKFVSTELLSLLTAIITLSMAFTPVLGLTADWLSRRRSNKIQPSYDTIDNESPSVIIAGFGRFGQMFGRILRVQRIPFVAIDHDSDQVELVRKFGNKVYYGDAARLDLLEAAGAATAKYLVLAIDDVESSLEITRLIKEKFPNLKVFARARNRGHQFDLMDLGVKAIKREMLDSSLNFVGELLTELGMKQPHAHTLIEKFRQHDEIMLQEQYKVRSDDKLFVSVSNQAMAQLAKVFSDEETKTYVSVKDPG
jgi:monovalent cation:proton antiporter-2 (CPA2) family protein